MKKSDLIIGGKYVPKTYFGGSIKSYSSTAWEKAKKFGQSYLYYTGNARCSISSGRKDYYFDYKRSPYQVTGESFLPEDVELYEFQKDQIARVVSDSNYHGLERGTLVVVKSKFQNYIEDWGGYNSYCVTPFDKTPASCLTTSRIVRDYDMDPLTEEEIRKLTVLNEPKKTFAVEKEFLLEAHKESTPCFKRKIEKMFPEALEQPEIFYHVGQNFLDTKWHKKYLLAHVDYLVVSLVDLESGNRYSDPKKIKDPSRITEEEFSSLFAGAHEHFKLI